MVAELHGIIAIRNSKADKSLNLRMGLTKNNVIERLKRVKPILERKYGINELALFGSYARDEATDNSDIDILVKLKTPSYRNLCNATYVLYSLFPQKKVQVVSMGGIKPQYFERLQKDLIYA